MKFGIAITEQVSRPRRLLRCEQYGDISCLPCSSERVMVPAK